MTRHRWASALLAIMIAVTALLGSCGVARADPDDGDPPILDDLLIIVAPGLTRGPGDRPAKEHGVGPQDWTGSGMYCQNRNVRCQKMGF